MVYSEPDLIIPALVELDKNSNGLTTTQLISKLRTRLNPTGHDIEIISGRKDDYFSQLIATGADLVGAVSVEEMS